MRKVDVERVLSQGSHVPKKLVANFISSNRPDLKQEVEDVLADQKDSADKAKYAAKVAEIDLKGFSKQDESNGAFKLSDGNMTVSVEPTENGKYQASFRGSKSSPHLQGIQGAVDWADAYRSESERAQKEESDKAKYAAKVAEIKAKQAERAIVPLSEITVTLKARIADSNEMAEYDEKADVALKEIDNKMNLARSLIKCLAS